MSGFFVSAGVYPSEVDLTTIVPAISTTVAGLVGPSNKGSLEMVLVTNRQQFVQEYGEPSPGNYFHYSALAFLDHGKQLYCRRVANAALYSGMSVVGSTSDESNAGFSMGQLTGVYYNDSSYSDECFSIMAKDPGAWGNSVSVIVKNSKDGDEDEVSEQYTFEIDVYFTDEDGTTIKVENWKLSRKVKIDGYGRQMYLEDRINNFSKYIIVADNTDVADTVYPKENASAVSLLGGANGDTVTPSDLIGTSSAQSGWYTFENSENVDVRMLIGGGFLSSYTDEEVASISNVMINICQNRYDCMAIVDVPYAATATDILLLVYRNVTLNANSSYGALYAPWAKINDAYNDRVIEVPGSGYVAAAYAYNDAVGKPWDAPAGFARGILNVLSFSRVFSQGSRDALYPAGINPLQVFRGEGNVIWGQRTLQAKDSALDRVNVRRLLIVIEKSMAISLRPFVFENNNDLTRFRLVAMLDEYLGMLSRQGAFQLEAGDDGYHILCTADNNPSSITDRNEMHVDVFVKPARTAEFIKLQTIVTPSGASFNELIARGVHF